MLIETFGIECKISTNDTILGASSQPECVGAIGKGDVECAIDHDADPGRYGTSN